MSPSKFELALREFRKNRDTASAYELIGAARRETLTAEEWHEIARFYFFAQEYERAQKALLSAAALYPDGIFSVSSDLALIFMKTAKNDASLFFAMLSRDPRQHVRIARQLIGADPELSDTILQACGFLLPAADHQLLVADESLRLKKFTEAEAAAQNSIDERDTPEAQLALARAKFALKKPVEAGAIVEANLSRLKKDFRAHELLAVAKEQAGAHKEALSHIQKALQLNPALRSGPGRAAKLRFLLGDVKGAAADVRIAKERMPKLASNWGLAGRIETALGNHDAAVENFRHEESLARTYLSALNLAYAYRRQGKEDEYRQQLKVGMERTYSLTRTTWDESKNLFILLAPGGGPILAKYALPGTALYIVDASATYYTLCAEHLADYVLDLVKTEKFENVVFIGSSKGAFAALVIGALVARSERCTAKVKALSFSPQIRLYPRNDNLVIPSYLPFLRRAEENEPIRDALVKYGDASAVCAASPNLEAILFYGRGYRMDAVEASLMTSPNVEKRDIAFSGHGILMCYTIPPGLSAESIGQKYAKLKAADEDMAALGAGDTVSLIDEMSALYFSGEHTLERIIAEVLPEHGKIADAVAP